MSKLLSPRAGVRGLEDMGERSTFVDGQRIGRARRRRPRRGTPLWQVVATVGLGLLGASMVVAGTHWLLTAPRFAVASVEVSGASRVSHEDVVAAAGIVPGTNVFRVHPSDVAARVEALPGIVNARVVRELPARVAIVVEERQPFTLAHAGRFVWVDETGHLLGEERRAIVPSVPLVSGIAEAEIADPSGQAGERVRAALAVIRTLLKSGSALGEAVSEVDMSGNDGPVLRTVHGVDVHLGSHDWADRLARLEGVLAQVASQDPRVAVVDLRFRDQVVLRGGGQR